MEISGNKYLHKKFKKQTSCGGADEKAEGGALPNGELYPESADNNKHERTVPNHQSTNCESSSVVETPGDQPLDHQSSISATVDISAQDPDALNASISESSTSSRDPSFDTHEPNAATTDQSSILNSAYSKSSDEGVKVTEAPTADRAGKYVCMYCNLACSKPSVLQKHIRAHTNERPYPCESCGFSFKTRSNLYKHCRSRTHANRIMGTSKHLQPATDSSVPAAAPAPATLIDEDKSPRASDLSADVPLPCPTTTSSIIIINTNTTSTTSSASQPTITWEQKTNNKPYKPRFHTAKLFFEETKLKENDSKLDNLSSSTADGAVQKDPAPEPPGLKSNPDLLKMRINELIHKNNSIVNCDDAVVIRRRNIDYIENNNNNNNNNESHSNHTMQWPTAEYRNVTDEPLNLTAKNRKRCLSDSENTQKSLIKELLLKNLSSDPNLQCQYCKMIFQTVTELEMHKIKYCNAKTSNIRYARSSSVNVASILTQNKNAFDNIPHMQHTTFPLKSPGPFLGKTRLIENEHHVEKYRTFSFDDNVIMHNTESDSPSYNKFMLRPPVGTYPLSPHMKKPPIKLFGGEVKITQTSGETRSFKIESKSVNKMQETDNFMDFSENLVIKSSLQSGGTVKANYSPKMDNLPSPNIIRVYDNTDIVSPSLTLPVLGDKPKFNYDQVPHEIVPQNDKLLTVVTRDLPLKQSYSVAREKVEPNYIDNTRHNNNDTKLDNDKDNELYKSNLRDFGQKAVKLLAPNLKPPNLTIPGLPIPNVGVDKIYRSPSVSVSSLEINNRIIDRDSFLEKQHIENLNFAKKQISLQQRMSEVSQPQNVNLYNPMNLLVDGKVIRYVPGIPGPIADGPTNLPLNTAISTGRITPLNKFNKDLSKSPRPVEESRDTKLDNPVATTSNFNQFDRKTPTIIVEQHETRQSDPKTSLYPNKTNQNMSRNNELHKPVETSVENKSNAQTVASSPEKITTKEESRKFVRPNSLALKPTSVSFKTHHGLTPTMFNQALISPDTPRVAKKYCQQYLNGNYFSYLGLKSSTKSVYCTLNKTQPFYVNHFKKLSMYSEWRQQESKIDSLSVTAYDSRQRQQKYTMAGQAKADLIAHSSYKFVTTETPTSKEDSSTKSNSVLGGYESNEDYTYIRGRGRGRYVCHQCGIRCKKPSMLKKHIRTHSNDRPYTCEHCNFSFKTKGNLTKHMKSKAHKYAATSSTSTQNSVTTSSESDESDAESSEESTRLQEHEAAHCLLSLSQKNNQMLPVNSQECSSSTSTSSAPSTSVPTLHLTEFSNFLKDDKFLKNPDQIDQVTNANFAKNKILDESSMSFNAPKHITEVAEIPITTDTNNVTQYLGNSSTIRPLTYPYLQSQIDLECSKQEKKNTEVVEYIPKVAEKYQTPTSEVQTQRQIIKPIENKFAINSRDVVSSGENKNKLAEPCSSSAPIIIKQIVNPPVSMPVIRQNDFVMQNVEGNLPANIVFRKRKLSATGTNSQYKVQRSDGVVDLSYPVMKETILDLSPSSSHNEVSYMPRREDGSDSIKLAVPNSQRTVFVNHEIQPSVPKTIELNPLLVNEHVLNYNTVPKPRNNSFSESNSSETFSQSSDTNDRVLTKPVDICENSLPADKPNEMYKSNIVEQSKTTDFIEHDQSAMQTLADIAIKQVKLEKNLLAKNVASEYLKLALNCDSNSDTGIKKFVSNNKESVNELIVKPEENKNCTICSKNFSKPSQLRLHMNIHYLERPFRCMSCSVSFRTKGHLQKHERSASHHNKLSSSPALSSSEPRPFKCTDCNIAFRIHGHLAKHLRSKMHIMKLECLAKIPFGLYAELERANSLLTEINTTDGDLCLESLKILAKKLFSNDPNKLDQLGGGVESRDS